MLILAFEVNKLFSFTKLYFFRNLAHCASIHFTYSCILDIPSVSSTFKSSLYAFVILNTDFFTGKFSILGKLG